MPRHTPDEPRGRWLVSPSPPGRCYGIKWFMSCAYTIRELLDAKHCVHLLIVSHLRDISWHSESAEVTSPSFFFQQFQIPTYPYFLRYLPKR